MLIRREFDMLCELLEHPGLTQRELATRLACSLGSVNTVYRKLVAGGLVEAGAVTPEGLRELEPYKVRNAVIMAAGMSSRFVPLSYEKPKGLLQVRGEVMIERHIEQLLSAGIRDIVLVVGYKKEQFFYLEEKYGVTIVVNDEFAQRNNNSTLMKVRKLLGNTYICTSDIYYTRNVFKPYQWKACYAAEFSEGHTDEWCITADASGRIRSVVVGGQNSWYMTDQAYFDRTFAERFVQILEAEYDDPRTAGKLWEEIFIEHIGELDMEIRKLEPGTVHEFDSLDALRRFDPLFMENVDSRVFDNITSVLGCTKSEIRDMYPLKQGLTNLSCHFATDGGEFVYRHPGIGTEEMIDRKAEVQALELARRIGIDSTYLYADPERGWKISRFIPNCRELDPHDPAQLAQAMQVARTLHAQPEVLDRSFDFLTEGLRYEQLLQAKGPIDVPGYEELRAQAIRVKELADSDGAPVCLTHNDFFHLNLLYDEAETLHLIDWEYAGMSDYASDYGAFVVSCQLSDAEADDALACYFERTPTLQERRHNFAYVGLAGWCWYVWALQKESEGDYVGDWLYTYYRYAKRYLQKALELYAE